MVASLLKILVSGIQDQRLLPPKGQPAVSFFQKVLIRAGRFTTQWVRLDFDQQPDFGKKVFLTVPRQGHLVSRFYVVANLPDIVTTQIQARNAAGQNFLGPTFGWTNSLGHALLQSVQLDIGGTTIDQLDSRLLEVLDEFKTPLEKTTVVNRLIERYDNGFTIEKIGWPPNRIPPRVAVPLPLWCSNGDAGSFLPIDALAVDKVRIGIQFAPLDKVYISRDISSTVLVQSECSTYPAILNSQFYQEDPSGSILIYNLNGRNGAVNSSPIPGYQMPPSLNLGDTYIMAEYIYLDKPEANRFRLADIRLPITQHYIIEPFQTKGLPEVSIPLKIPNPTRDLYFFAQRVEAAAQYNAPFLATRDLSGLGVLQAPWWPDASGLNARFFTGDYIPGFATRDSEPIQSINIVYEGRLIRYGTTSPALFRSIIPSFDQRKTPWINRYYYTFPFGVQSGLLPGSQPSGEANLTKIRKIDLNLTFNPKRGCVALTEVPNYTIFIYAETYNILRVYGGRAAIMFAY